VGQDRHVAEILVSNDRRDILDVKIEPDPRVRQVRAFSDARVRRGPEIDAVVREPLTHLLPHPPG